MRGGSRVRPAFESLLYPRRLLRMKFVLKRRRITRLDTHPAKPSPGSILRCVPRNRFVAAAVISLRTGNAGTPILLLSPGTVDETGWAAVQVDDSRQSGAAAGEARSNTYFLRPEFRQCPGCRRSSLQSVIPRARSRGSGEILP